MTVIIKKGAAEKEIQSAVKKMNKKNVRPRLTDFYGELRGKYGEMDQPIKKK